MSDYATINVRREGEITVVEVLTRRVYLHVAEEFQKEISEVLAASPGDVLIDLRRVSIMNSAGLGVLISAHDELAKQNRRLVIANLQPLMQEIFGRMKLASILTVAESLEQGMNRLRGEA